MQITRTIDPSVLDDTMQVLLPANTETEIFPSYVDRWLQVVEINSYFDPGYWNDKGGTGANVVRATMRYQGLEGPKNVVLFFEQGVDTIVVREQA